MRKYNGAETSKLAGKLPDLPILLTDRLTHYKKYIENNYHS